MQPAWRQREREEPCSSFYVLRPLCLGGPDLETEREKGGFLGFLFFPLLGERLGEGREIRECLCFSAAATAETSSQGERTFGGLGFRFFLDFLVGFTFSR
jgi:hypothetical protein